MDPPSTEDSAGSVAPEPTLLLVPIALEVVAVPELLTSILAQADLATCASAALVCRKWNSLATKELWKDHENPKALYNILSPLDVGGDDPELSFTSAITPANWERFLSAAANLRKLLICEEKFDLHVHSMHEVAVGRPVLNMVPGLRSLRVEASTPSHLTHSHLFFSPSLVNIELAVWCEKSNVVITTLHAIRPLKMLKKLCMWGLTETALSIPTTFSVLSELETLEHLEMDADTLAIIGIANIASKLPRLRVFDLCEVRHLASSGDPQPTLPTLENPTTGFLALQRFEFSRALLQSVIAIIKFSPFSNISQLVLENIVSEDAAGEPHVYHELFAAIVAVCPQTTELRVKIKESHTPIDFAAMKPVIFQLRLRVFRIAHNRPLDITEFDLDEIAKSVGSLIEEIDLNHHPPGVVDEPARLYPPHRTYAPLTLSALIPFAKYCPRLQDLGLFIDAIPPISPPSAGTFSFPPTLRKINFGHSLIKDNAHVIRFLSAIDGIKIGQETTDKVCDHTKAWKNVGSLLLVLEEKAKEAKELRQRIEALESQLKRMAVVPTSPEA